MRISEITSDNNQIFRKLKSIKEKKGRDQHGLFFIEGRRFLSEAVERRAGVEIVCMTADFRDRFGSGMNIPDSALCCVVPERLMDKLSDTVSGQGVCAAVRIPDEGVPDFRRPGRGFYVILDKVQDPGNMGTIIRTCHAAGADGIILGDGCVDPYNTKTLRSTMGSVFAVRLIRGGRLEDTIGSMRAAGWTVYAAALRNGRAYTGLRMWQPERLAIVIGNEGNGVSESVIDACGASVYIPMPGGAESLNAAAAAAILIYERIRAEVT